jgi:hypothetical protein
MILTQQVGMTSTPSKVGGPWAEVIHKRGQSRKALASLAMLVSWEIWKERNARVFRNKSVTIAMLVTKIKDEANLWRLAGAKALSNVMPRE